MAMAATIAARKASAAPFIEAEALLALPLRDPVCEDCSATPSRSVCVHPDIHFETMKDLLR